jgi:O-acetyl-ADP-ribose deacetylase (regulator of RNase III)
VISGLAVRVGELGKSDAAAVVRAVRADGEAITAAGRRLELLAGSSVSQRLQGLGDLPVGGAVITPAGDLPSQFIIHAVLQSVEDPVTSVTVRRALVNVLRRARDLGIASLALPLLGAGAGNLDAEEAARLLVEALREHIGQGEAPISFEIVVENAYEEGLFAHEIPVRNSAGESH